MIQKRIVAVVDDDTSVLSGLSSLMRSAGHSVSTYVSGETFLASCDLERVCCLVSDIHLPGGMSGFELQDAIAVLGIRVPVVLMTGLVNDAVRAKASARGALACMQKPVDSETLLDHIASACVGR